MLHRCSSSAEFPEAKKKKAFELFSISLVANNPKTSKFRTERIAFMRQPFLTKFIFHDLVLIVADYSFLLNNLQQFCFPKWHFQV